MVESVNEFGFYLEQNIN